MVAALADGLAALEASPTHKAALLERNAAEVAAVRERHARLG